jgi:hypothetical protein
VDLLALVHARHEGHAIGDATLALTTPLMRKHLNPFGRYHFDLERLDQPEHDLACHAAVDEELVGTVGLLER